MTKFLLVQFLSICRQQNCNDSKIEIYRFGRIENIMEKGENAAYQHFLLFPMFSKTSFPYVSNIGIVWQRFKRGLTHKQTNAF